MFESHVIKAASITQDKDLPDMNLIELKTKPTEKNILRFVVLIRGNSKSLPGLVGKPKP